MAVWPCASDRRCSVEQCCSWRASKSRTECFELGFPALSSNDHLSNSFVLHLASQSVATAALSSPPAIGACTVYISVYQVVAALCYTEKSQTPGNAEEHKRQETPTINPIGPTDNLTDQAPSTTERTARETHNTN